MGSSKSQACTVPRDLHLFTVGRTRYAYKPESLEAYRLDTETWTTLRALRGRKNARCSPANRSGSEHVSNSVDRMLAELGLAKVAGPVARHRHPPCEPPAHW